MADTQPGIATTISMAGEQISKVSTVFSKGAEKMKETPVHVSSIAVSCVVVIVLLIVLGIGRGIFDGLKDKENDVEKRAGRSFTHMEDAILMVVVFAILIATLGLQAKHFMKNMSWGTPAAMATQGFRACWISITITMIVAWSVATAKYHDEDSDSIDKSRGKAVRVVFHTGVIITIGVLALLATGAGTFAHMRR